MKIISIGSNLSSRFGNRFINIKKTIEFLIIEKITILNKSSFYETPSYPNNSNPKFVNVILNIDSNFSTKKLFKIFLNIENRMGRIRKIKNDPRTCDIDIIDLNGKILNDNSLILPHPRAHLRNFVLYPLKEICPNWIHPINKKTIDELIKNLDLSARNQIIKIKEKVL
ncbi:MAG: 2-amino-4-hydroxy-6-hydroxymethyldihydropteridine diphosphokinase [Pelagibacteraceae bacterium]